MAPPSPSRPSSRKYCDTSSHGYTARRSPAGRARDYRERLVKEYAPATVAREIKRARQFFEYAKDCKIIAEHPFARIRAGSQRNTSRKCFVSREVIDAVLATCPDNEWRLIVVLARYAGLRIPSELEEVT
jgi:site-specific recombinase XerD